MIKIGSISQQEAFIMRCPTLECAKEVYSKLKNLIRQNNKMYVSDILSLFGIAMNDLDYVYYWNKIDLNDLNIYYYDTFRYISLPRPRIDYSKNDRRKNSDTSKEKEDLVNHPNHYQSETGLEVIDVIDAFTDGLDGVEAFDTGNIIKYICRWKKKNGIEDLEKAKWYLENLIKEVKEKENEDAK